MKTRKKVCVYEHVMDDDGNIQRKLVEKKSKNRHSFTLESNGYRLVFHERNEDMIGEPYCCRFSLMSYDSDNNYAYLGLGKEQKNDAASFTDAVDKEMMELARKRTEMMENIRNLQRKLAAVDEFLDALPKIMLEDGI